MEQVSFDIDKRTDELLPEYVSEYSATRARLQAIQLAREAANARAEKIADRLIVRAHVNYPGATYMALMDAAEVARATITKKPEGATPLSSYADVRGGDTLSDACPSDQQRLPALSQAEQDARTLERAVQLLNDAGRSGAADEVRAMLASWVVPKAEPDMFEAFNMTRGTDRGAAARDWFGSLVKALEDIASFSEDDRSKRIAKEAIVALRDRVRRVN